jgi:hypothetical protein
VPGPCRAEARGLDGRRPAREAVREPGVHGLDRPVPERHGEAQVGGGQAVGELGGRPAAEVEDRRREQDEIDERDADQERGAQAGPAQQVPRREPGAEQDPEADLAGDDDRDQHTSRYSTTVLER